LRKDLNKEYYEPIFLSKKEEEKSKAKKNRKILGITYNSKILRSI